MMTERATPGKSSFRRPEAIIRKTPVNDRLIEAEIAANKLVRVSSIELDDYGYFLTYLPNALQNRSLKLFRDWILDEATEQP